MAQTQEFEKRYCEARHKVIEAAFSKLNSVQRQAVMTTEGPLLLLAGAGSGKTTVLINRIANLIRYGRGSDSAYVPEAATEEDLAILEAAAQPEAPPAALERAESLAALDPCPPWRIIAITFTNKAADELKARLERMLGPAGNGVWAMTFHSACVRILRREGEKLGYPSSFAIYDTADSQAVVKRVLKELDLDEKIFPCRSLLAEISRAKDAQLGPEQYLAQAEQGMDIRKKRIAQVYMEYSRRLREAGAMDFDDLIANTVRIFQEFPEVRQFYQEKFRYVLIDEYQDTNNLQYLLASLLAGGRENICVVGDDDQSIYKFRGATIENILSFENQYKDARTIRLEQNYRSKGHILSAANSVIRNNRGRKGKRLWTQEDDGEKLTLYTARNESDEAQYVATKLVENFGAGTPWRSNAILYRMNAQSNQLEYACKRSGIPYRILGGTRFFDRAEVKDMLAYLCLIQNPGDDLRLLRIVNVPARGIGERTMETVREIAQREGQSLFQILDRAHTHPELARSAPRLRAFAGMITDLQELTKSSPAEEVYDEVLERTGYIRALEEKKNDENLVRVENVRELKSNIIQFAKDSGDASLAGFLDQVALYTDLDNYDRDTDCVVMMTMHSAKGLEFDNVFLVGMEEGIFPGLRAIGEQEEMEEERRLCYVGLTRARERLYLTCASQRMIFGRTSANKVSRFVEEISEADLERTGAQPGWQFSVQDGVPGGAEYGTRREGYVAARPRRTERQMPRRAPVTAASKAPENGFLAGDLVSHRAFGPGIVQNVTPMGGDALLEILFESAGTKRLMQRAAAQHMTKRGKDNA